LTRRGDLVLADDEEVESLEPDEDLFGLNELFRVTPEGANE
jgi:hypothetical protein